MQICIIMAFAADVGKAEERKHITESLADVLMAFICLGFKTRHMWKSALTFNCM
jgi:hypothetical protein